MKKFAAGLIVGLFLAVSTAVYAAGPVHLVINNKEFFPDVPAQVLNGRTMVPVRTVAEAFGARVEWEQATSTVKITQSAKTVIVEPEKLNDTGTITISGTDEFKQAIHDTMEQLRIRSPEDYYLVQYYVNTISDGGDDPNNWAVADIHNGGVTLYWDRITRVIPEMHGDVNLRPAFAACLLAHEAYHIYQHQKGLKDGVNVLEYELMAMARGRKVLIKFGLPEDYYFLSDLNKEVDKSTTA